jgi:hypothetical protein
MSRLLGSSIAALAGAFITCASMTAGHAGILNAPLDAKLAIHNVDCAVGMHIGPVGACVGGSEEAVLKHTDAPVVIERRTADAPTDVTTEKSVTHDANGCTTKTIEKTDDMGNSAAKSKSNC